MDVETHRINRVTATNHQDESIVTDNATHAKGRKCDKNVQAREYGKRANAMPLQHKRQSSMVDIHWSTGKQS